MWNPKYEIPAFAEAASRRQAKYETDSDYPKREKLRNLTLRGWS